MTMSRDAPELQCRRVLNTIEIKTDPSLTLFYKNITSPLFVTMELSEGPLFSSPDGFRWPAGLFLKTALLTQAACPLKIRYYFRDLPSKKSETHSGFPEDRLPLQGSAEGWLG